MSEFREIDGETRDLFLRAYHEIAYNIPSSFSTDSEVYFDGFMLSMVTQNVATFFRQSEEVRCKPANVKMGTHLCSRYELQFQKTNETYGPIVLPLPEEFVGTFEVGLIDYPVEVTVGLRYEQF